MNDATRTWPVTLCASLLLVACAEGSDLESGGSLSDGGRAPALDATTAPDGSGPGMPDSGAEDAGAADGSVDSGTVVPMDGGSDSALPDSGPIDSGRDVSLPDLDIDADVIDTGPIDNPDCGKLVLTIRDFGVGHVDMGNAPALAETTGIVQSTLGSDRKPVFLASNGQVSSAASFLTWYANWSAIPDSNPDKSHRWPTDFEVEIELTEVSSGQFRYENPAFFPIDGLGFGNEGNSHNFHFTTEAHTTFLYRGGEQFTFSGDDDIWVFVNDRLAIDLGGMHGRISRTIDFDARASELEITVGNVYSLDIFHAERDWFGLGGSTFGIETSIGCLVSVPIN